MKNALDRDEFKSGLITIFHVTMILYLGAEVVAILIAMNSLIPLKDSYRALTTKCF